MSFVGTASLSISDTFITRCSLPYTALAQNASIKFRSISMTARGCYQKQNSIKYVILRLGVSWKATLRWLFSGANTAKTSSMRPGLSMIISSARFVNEFGASNARNNQKIIISVKK